MKVKLISAVSIDGAIGKKQELLWHIKGDLQFYKEQTLNKFCIVGLNTYNGLPAIAKKNRTYLIVNGEDDIKKCDRYIIGFKDPKSTIDYVNELGQEECIIVGGAMLYETSIKYVDECLITWVNKTYKDADAFFPIDYLFKHFECVNDSNWIKNDNGLQYKFTKYLR